MTCVERVTTMQLHPSPCPQQGLPLRSRASPHRDLSPHRQKQHSYTHHTHRPAYTQPLSALTPTPPVRCRPLTLSPRPCRWATAPPCARGRCGRAASCAAAHPPAPGTRSAASGEPAACLQGAHVLGMNTLNVGHTTAAGSSAVHSTRAHLRSRLEYAGHGHEHIKAAGVRNL